MMMMMKTTQPAYTPTVSASARSQTCQSNTPFHATNTPSAIGSVETDAYQPAAIKQTNTNTTTAIVGNPQARSGKMSIALLVATVLAGYLLAQEPVRVLLTDLLKKLANTTKHSLSAEPDQPSSHRHRIKDDTDTLTLYDDDATISEPPMVSEKTEPPPTTKLPHRHQKRPKGDVSHSLNMTRVQ
jgi:hypothetical protein